MTPDGNPRLLTLDGGDTTDSETLRQAEREDRELGPWRPREFLDRTQDPPDAHNLTPGDFRTRTDPRVQQCTTTVTLIY